MAQSKWIAYHISNALCFYLPITFPYAIFFAKGLSLHLCLLKFHPLFKVNLKVFLDHPIQNYLPSHVTPMTSHVYSLMMFSPYCLMLQFCVYMS